MVYSTDQAHTIEAILEDAEDMLEHNHDSLMVTEREVHVLRKAFHDCVEALPEGEKWNQDTKKCDDILKKLEEFVHKTPTADTGDVDEELHGLHRYAPLKIPPRRRLQTFCISLLLFFTGLPACALFSLYLCFIPLTAPFIIAYWLYIIFVPLKHPVKGWSWWRDGFIMHQYRDYFPVRCVCHKEDRLKFDSKKNYMFCYHPHGVHSFGVMVNFYSDTSQTPRLFPGLTFHVQTLKLNFLIPFWRSLFIWGGAGDASSGCIKKTLSAGPGHCAVLVVGGAEESLMSSPHTNELLLSKRKGFVKIALQMGSPLVPVFGFGETDVYGNYADGRPWLQKLLKRFQKKFGFAPILIKGRGWFNYDFGVLPHRRPIVTVVGAPVVVPQISNPTQEDIDKYHKLYVEALMKVYKENKSVYDVLAKTEAHIAM